jgi:hypothetical protein
MDLTSQMCPAIEMCYITLWSWGSNVHVNLSNCSYTRDEETKVPKMSLGARLRDNRALLVIMLETELAKLL